MLRSATLVLAITELLCVQIPASADGVVNTFGMGTLSCVEFLHAVDTEKDTERRYGPTASPGEIYITGTLLGYMGFVGGYFSAMNNIDNNLYNPKNTTYQVPFLENYCRTHTLDIFYQAVYSLRIEILKQAGYPHP